VATVVVFALWLARPIRRLPFLTLPELVELRYGRTARHCAAWLIVWYMVLLAASQMVALGNFLRAFIGASYFNSLVLGTAVVLVYSVFGGFFSVVLTDGIQFFFLASGILALFVWTVGAAPPPLRAVISAPGAGGFDFFLDFKRNFLIFLSFLLAWTISPITWQRIQAARTVRQARRGLFAAAAALIVFFGCIVFIGMACRLLFAGSQPSSPILSHLISGRTGPALGLLLFISVTAAIMSTMDTAINTGALSLTGDLLGQVRPGVLAAHSVAAGRLATLFVGGLAFAVATRFQDILKTLGLASEIMAEGLFIPGMAMLFLKRRLPWAGLTALGLGSGFALAGFFTEVGLLSLPLPRWPFSLPMGILFSCLGFGAGAVIDELKRRA